MTDWTPAKATVNIARDLRDITTLYRLLPYEALHHANDHEYPGGEAVNLAGPAANLEAWEHRYETAERLAGEHGMPAPDYAGDQIGTELHPLLVLASWEDTIRDHRDQPTDLRATVARAATYIRNSLDWATDPTHHAGECWLPLAKLESEIRGVLHHLESNLKPSRPVDKGAPCLGDTCEGAHLELIWAPNTRDDSRDVWRCPNCRRVYDKMSYRLAVHHASLTHATELTATQLCALHNIKHATLRKWVERGRVEKRGRDQSGRTLYDVEQALIARDGVLQSATECVTLEADRHTQNQGAAVPSFPAQEGGIA